jgi:hypothetical protein
MGYKKQKLELAWDEMEYYKVILLFFVNLNLCFTQEIHIRNRKDIIKFDYKTNLVLAIDYRLNEDQYIYKYGKAALGIESIYADNVKLNISEDGIDGINIPEIEYYRRETIVEKRILFYYIPNSHLWLLHLVPRGYVVNSTAYYIPGDTRILRFFYYILYPNGKSSDVIEKIIQLNNNDQDNMLYAEPN